MIRLVFTAVAILSCSPVAAGEIAAGVPHYVGASQNGAAMDHAAHMRQTVSLPAPIEPGQGAFAAIQEIVALLEADPATDWASVDIEALRQHLTDMNEVTLNTLVDAEPIEAGMRFRVSGEGRTRDAVRRMVTAHAATMNGRDDWMFAAEKAPSGAILIVRGDTVADQRKIRALGFIGVMARGMHHQEHHLMIAAGNAPHL